MTTESGQITLAIDERRVATICIDRPAKLNALSLEMVAQLEQALAELRGSDARVVVIRSAGDRAFSVGADIRQFSTFSPADMWRRWIAEGHRVLNQLADLRQPTVAAVDGIAVGGGLEVALSCDFRIAADRASFGLPELGIGTIPGWGGTDRLTRLIGASRASEMILARRRVDAAKALSWGLVNEVHPVDQFEAALADFVDELLASPAIAQQAAKQLIQAAAVGASPAVLEALASGFTASSHDFIEGLNAFLEKRPPRFSGDGTSIP